MGRQNFGWYTTWTSTFIQTEIICKLSNLIFLYWIQKNEFLTASFKYLLNGYFALEIFDARLEPILTKKNIKDFYNRLFARDRNSV